jgi:hypothetical protein
MAKYALAHETALADRRQILLGITKLQPFWQKLPLGPYPPASDSTNFPRTGDRSLLVTSSGVSQAQRDEPGKITANQAAMAAARRPKLSPLFWVGLACLGAGILVLRAE